jgi:hypothetical protein
LIQSEVDLHIPPVIHGPVLISYGDFSLPEASAIEYVQRARTTLKKDPQAALAAAQHAVAIVSDGFDANVALGDAAAATGDFPTAKAAYDVAMRRVDQMEPSAQERWRPILQKKIASTINKTT